MVKKCRNLYVPIFALIIISLCSMYSLGIFDNYFLKNVSEENYSLGDFSYTGQILNGKFQNKGIIKLHDGSTYIGNFKNGDLFGAFTYSAQDDCSICGIFEDGNIIEAKLTSDNYKASINRENEINYENNKGWSYVGQFNIWGQNGEGTFTYRDKSKYVGTFSQGLADKNGTFYSKDGKINYQGNLCNGVFHGFGVYTFGASEYSGDFLKGLPEGKGVYKSKNGWTYEGNLKSGVFDGDGTVTDVSGKKSNTVFKNGKRVI